MNRERLLVERERIGTWGKLNQERLKTTLRFAGEKILEVGCADGTLTDLLHQKGYDICGVDCLFSKTWKPALRKYFVVADAVNLPFESNSFDTVLAFEVLEHLRDVDQGVEEMVRVCRQNLVITTPDAELYPYLRESGLVYFPWADRTHVNFFTGRKLQNFLINKGLSIKYFSRINPVFPERILLESFGLPARVTRFLQKFLRHLPRRNKFRMTLLVVAGKPEKMEIINTESSRR